MALADQYYWRSDGRQISGTAKRQNGNAYIYNSAGQIFPREITVTLGSGDFGGGSCDVRTYRTGNDNRNNSWRDKAFQGAKSQTTNFNLVHYCWGHITPPAQKRINNAGLEVLGVSIRCHTDGNVGRRATKTLEFHVGLSNDPVPALEGTYYYTLDDSYAHDFYLDDNSSLRELMKIYLQRGACFMLHNGETSLAGVRYNDGSGYGSMNYAAITSFVIESVTVKYIP